MNANLIKWNVFEKLQFYAKSKKLILAIYGINWTHRVVCWSFGSAYFMWVFVCVCGAREPNLSCQLTTCILVCIDIIISTADKIEFCRAFLKYFVVFNHNNEHLIHTCPTIIYSYAHIYACFILQTLFRCYFVRLSVCMCVCIQLSNKHNIYEHLYYNQNNHTIWLERVVCIYKANALFRMI